VRAVAKWFILAVTAPAEGNGGSPGEVELISLLIEDLEFPFNPYTSVIFDGDFRCHVLNPFAYEVVHDVRPGDRRVM